MKRTKIARIALVLLFLLALALSLASCGKVSGDPSDISLDTEIVSSDFSDEEGVGSAAVTVTVANGSPHKLGSIKYKLTLMNIGGDELHSAEYESAEPIPSGESAVFRHTFGENDGIVGKVKVVRVTPVSMTFLGDDPIREDSIEELEINKKTALVMAVIGFAVCLIGGILIFVSKTLDIEPLIYVSAVFLGIGAPFAVFPLIAYFTGALAFVLGMGALASSAICLILKSVSLFINRKSLVHRNNPFDVFIFFAPVYFALGIIAFLKVFPNDVQMTLGIGAVALSLIAFFVYLWARDSYSQIAELVADIVFLVIFAVGVLLIFNQFLSDLFLSAGIGFAISFILCAFLIDGDNKATIIPYPIIGGLSLICLVIGLFDSVWYMIGSIGALITLGAAALFISAAIFENENLDIPQAISAGALPAGAFAAAFGLLSAALGDPILMCVIAAGVTAAVSVGLYFLKFFYEKHVCAKHGITRTSYTFSWKCKKICREALDTIMISSIVSALCCIVIAAVMIVIKVII
ncbi:MAG: hypothetical protein IJY18_01280 [Clostridia bacterium]|nr:hypothetical protein [Clostridia bacterium]